ncbi:ThuA domain-containing protein [Herbiconiux sp. CPCC 205716]|uniref:ThuA domain-containing protein n=1 Tax=Herbiconiux gentiana TaxID=2970912 RepID=A0ABT2GHN5_9MICO|nr:ThuA domain-containing protein [Herbiconiux gentiana]MCS5715734.1 ThuA domain-containing protein [Herbiconiux gentiana]
MTPDPDAAVLDGLRVLVLIGVGEHGDPWHGLEATGGRAGEVLRGAGAAVEVLGTDRADALPGALARSDLLVVAVSGDPALPPPDSTALVDAICTHEARGGGVLGLHSATLAFAGDPRWAELLGGRWVPGVSGHPPIGEALVRRARALPELAVPVQLPVPEFVVHDERYSDLEVSGEVETVAFHTEGGVEHPLVWVKRATANPSSATAGRATAGRATAGQATAGRVAYDALGHGVESYDSPEHRRLLVALARWAVPAASTDA